MSIIGSVRFGLASAPSNPVDGQVYYDTGDDKLYIYHASSTSWVGAIAPHLIGGTVSGYDGHTVHTFTSSGTLVVSGASATCHVLVVGGGGGGGRRHGGGGGAGGLIYKQNHSFGVGRYTVTVGNGGNGAHSSSGSSGTNGQDSSIDSLFIAKGGAIGACDTAFHSNTGGCGGGSDDGSSNYGTAIQRSQSGDSGTYGFGNDGAAYASWTGGGGGGAGAAGSGQNGGNGLQEGTNISYASAGTVTFDINGTGNWYAGGGGGGQFSGGPGRGDGGSGGGGTGMNYQEYEGTNGTANTGGGGGGEGDDALYGMDGGSGIVIIRYG